MDFENDDFLVPFRCALGFVARNFFTGGLSVDLVVNGVLVRLWFTLGFRTFFATGLAKDFVDNDFVRFIYALAFGTKTFFPTIDEDKDNDDDDDDDDDDATNLELEPSGIGTRL